MIYLDMDGVLADFDKGLESRGFKNNLKTFRRPKEEWSEDDHKEDLQVKKLMDIPGFFSVLEPISDAFQLWQFCAPYKPIVLTARPKTGGDRVVKEKRQWIEKHFGEIPNDRFICCLRSEKKSFIGSTPHYLQILVDDLLFNCEEWSKAGGIGVLHTSAEDSIKKISMLIQGTVL